MSERFKSVVCADLLITKIIEGQKYVLLMKRKNTGFNDGEYEIPGGHLEPNEDLFLGMIREAKEELLLDLHRNDLKVIHLMHHYTGERLNFIFEADGEFLNPQIGETDKCEKLEWFPISNPPKNTTKKVQKMLKNISNNIFYDYM